MFNSEIEESESLVSLSFLSSHSSRNFIAIRTLCHPDLHESVKFAEIVEDLLNFPKIMWRHWRRRVINAEMGLVWTLAGMSILGFVFASIWFVDPALLTLLLRFRQAQCRTIDSKHRVGISNCEWTSCRIGCTRDIYECWQIEVEFEFLNKSKPLVPNFWPLANAFVDNKNDFNENFDNFEHNEYNNDDKEIDNNKELVSTRLYPNVRGCGYPPWLSCDAFYSEYSNNTDSFDCWVSTMDERIALTNLDLNQARTEVLLSLLPLMLFIVAVLYAFCRLGVFTMCNFTRTWPRAADTRARMPADLSPLRLYNYKRALHMRRISALNAFQAQRRRRNSEKNFGNFENNRFDSTQNQDLRIDSTRNEGDNTAVDEAELSAADLAPDEIVTVASLKKSGRKSD